MLTVRTKGEVRNYPNRIEVTDWRNFDAMEAWCVLEIGVHGVDWDCMSYEYGIFGDYRSYFAFQRPKDALLFKMRWVSE